MHTPVDTESLELSPCLLRAIEEHKYLKSHENGGEVDFLVAARDFLANHEGRWRAAKTRADSALQVQEMRRHLWIESEKAGRDVGRTAAGTDWVAKHAGAWRRQRESLCGNDFREIVLDLDGTHAAEALDSAIAAAGRLNADVFVSQDSVGRPHFRLEREPGAQRLPFLVFRSARLDDLAQLRLGSGDRLLFIAYGSEAEPALQAVRAALA